MIPKRYKSDTKMIQHHHSKQKRSMIARVSHTIIIDICPLKICFSVAIVAQADFYQGTAAALIRMPSCPVCRWRERVLPHNQGEAPHPSCRVLRLPTLITDTEDVVATLEKEPLRTRSDMHKRPPKLWIDILSTKTVSYTHLRAHET